MTQKGNRRKQAPTYSADTLALRFIAGFALVALGVMIFMAVDLAMTGNIFEGLRQLAFGLSGSLAYVLAALPLWAGGLVLWSAQRRAPARPWIFAFLSFWGICTFVMLISGGAMESLTQQGGGSFGGAVSSGYRNCAGSRTGGGALGMVAGWPLWKLGGNILGAVVIFLATAFCLLMIFNLTPARLWGLMTGKADQRRQEQQNQRISADEQQMRWQQQQAMQQQAAWQQQQYILQQQQQQQQAMQHPVNPPGGGWNVPANAQAGAGQTGSRGIENWQEQAAAQQAATGHQSRIFGRKDAERPQKPVLGGISRIFRKDRDEAYDGLVDRMPTGPAARERRPATGFTQQAENDPELRQETRRERSADEAQQEMPIRPATGQQPEEGGRGQYGKPVRPMSELKPEEAESPAAPVSTTGQKTGPRNMDAYRRPVEKKPKEETAEDGNFRKKQKEETAAPGQAPKKPVPPAVQMEISRETYAPEVKLPPSEKAPHTPEEEEWFPIPYHYPPITDLAMPKAQTEDTAAEDAARSRKLEETLASFKVQARVVNVTHGPAISRFELELAAGTKVNKVSELEKDIAYGMEATSIRIEAPIPGKSLVGVEVPNRKVATVTLREVLQSEKMQNAKSLLTVALGRDIAGTPIVCDLAKMPHMLIAGQTGSGKSVCINAIINSLLYRASPDEVKLILVDPKVVELQCYNGIPHLLIPVVNDPHKAAAALAWAVAEMMDRYDKFAERGVRNLDGYNASLKQHERPMTRIVIIIDELADLMMVCKKDVEEYICRLTQLARAAGIHLIVATQRPSVDVITGLIKANIPSRIAFKTASYVDSRTILDRNGSEQLLGWGDMLYLPTGSFAPTRVQGCFLSDEEVNRIVEHVREANPSTYDPDILEKLEQIASGSAAEGTGADVIGGAPDMGNQDGSLFEQAVEFAIADGQISTSTLQRRLKIGYARAGRLTDEMEERGIVAAKDGSKPRKCLITREEWEEMKQSTEGMT